MATLQLHNGRWDSGWPSPSATQCPSALQCPRGAEPTQQPTGTCARRRPGAQALRRCWGWPQPPPNAPRTCPRGRPRTQRSRPRRSCRSTPYNATGTTEACHGRAGWHTEAPTSRPPHHFFVFVLQIAEFETCRGGCCPVSAVGGEGLWCVFGRAITDGRCCN